MSAAPMTVKGEAPVVAADRFPVTVTTPDGDVLRAARVILTVPHPDQAGRILVWTRPGEPRESMPYDPAASLISSPIVDWSVATPAGAYVIRRQGGGCCGNPLKSWVPFTPYRMGKLR